MYMPSDAIEVKVTGAVGTILLNRPGKRNALTRAMLEHLREALDDLYRERRVRAIILAGSGSAFCAGMDLTEIQAVADEPEPHLVWGQIAAEYRDLVVQMLEVSKPIIASVHGPAVAGGAGLVLASDLVVASTEALFGLPDPRRGVVAGVVGPLLAFRVGAGHAARLLLSSELYSAQEAHRIGVFHELIDTERVWARAVELGEQCAQGAPEAVQLTKRLLTETVGETLMTQLSAGAAISATSRTTEAAQEGTTAFLEKRPPEWK